MNSSNERTPKLTVLMPSLNVVGYIRQCLDSVTGQTMQDLQVICIDAGSTDGTLEILKEYQGRDGRITLLISDKKSYGYQMNLGLDAAEGEYIGIVETDDYADPSMFALLYAKAKTSGADVVMSNYYHQRGDSSVMFEHLAGLPYNRVFCPGNHLSLLMRAPAIWSGIYRHGLLKKNKIRFLETPGASFQDTSFILKVWISAEKVVLLKQPYLHYRVDNPNSSVKSPEKMFFVRDEMLEVHRFLQERPEKMPAYQNVVWNREADSYEWNFRRLSDSLKYDFLCGVRDRFREGLEQGLYDRKHLRWDVWKMILETAEDPFIYLKGHMDPDVYEELIKSQRNRAPSSDSVKAWKRKEAFMYAPQTAYDMVHHAAHYGLKYCIDKVTGKNR